MAIARTTIEVTVETQRGTPQEARSVLRDVIDRLRETDMAYLSVGEVRVTVRRVKATR